MFKRGVLVLLTIAFILVSVTSCSSRTDFDIPALEAKAEALVENMLEGNFEDARVDFSDDVLAVLTEDVLKEGWVTTVEPLGSYVGHVSTDHRLEGKYCIINVLSQFEGNGVLVTATFDANGKIAGLRTTYQEIGNLETKAALNEIEITITGDVNYPLAGILTMPDNVDKPPVVILVHGSGASDMDETISGNTPFRDIAYGLAERGIASIRYHKRFYSYPQAASELGNSISLEQEVLEDVYAAIELAKTDNRIDTEGIYLLGHSLGGSLAPAIAHKHPELAGIISMAGTLRPLYEVSYDQVQEAAEAMRPTLSDTDKSLLEEQLKQIEGDVEMLRNIPATISEDTRLLDLPVNYWRSLGQYNGLNYIDRIAMPILVLQGEADFQVYHDVDFTLWQEKLTGRENAVLRLYPGLNHLMMPTQNKRDLSEYVVKSKVSEEVIDDIAVFINNGSPSKL